MRTLAATHRTDNEPEWEGRDIPDKGEDVPGFDTAIENPLTGARGAVRRDLTGYQHLHPRMSRDGTWSAPLTVSQPGAYRAFADFQLECQKYVLAADVIAPGALLPRAPN